MIRNVLALDLATTLGWCLGAPKAGLPTSGFARLPVAPDEVGPTGAAYEAWLSGILANPANAVDLVVMEAPMPTTGGVSSARTIMLLQGLCYHTEVLCHRFKVRVRQVEAATWKKAFCGTGRVSKKMRPYPPIVACRTRGIGEVTDHNQADAVGVWYYAAAKLAPGEIVRFDPLFRAGEAHHVEHAA